MTSSKRQDDKSNHQVQPSVVQEMRIFIRCPQEGCGAVFGGEESSVLGKYSKHMGEHELRIREDNGKALDLSEATFRAPSKRKKRLRPQSA
jgi:hypothetical protein